MSTPARAPRRRTDAATRPSPRPQPRGTARPSASGSSAARAPQRDGIEERPDLHVVTPGRGRTLKLRILGAVAAALLFGALLGLAVFHSVLVQGQLQLDGLDDQIAEEQVRQSELRFEEARLAAPERIQAEAARLGMVPPVDREYLQAVVPGSVVPPPGSGE